MPSSTPKSFPEQEIQAIDALFQKAGLKRSLRESSAGVTRRMRLERAEPQALTPPAPQPQVASNGVEWLAATNLKRTNWLWHGFSTRRGGLSRAYCADNAPGELNLGFTAQDDRVHLVIAYQAPVVQVSGAYRRPDAVNDRGFRLQQGVAALIDLHPCFQELGIIIPRCM